LIISFSRGPADITGIKGRSDDPVRAFEDEVVDFYAITDGKAKVLGLAVIEEFRGMGDNL